MAVAPLRAQTWLASPGSNDFNTDANWTPALAPNNTSATAIFDTSVTTSIGLSANTDLDGIVFNSGAPSYSLYTNTSQLSLYGTGITNNSGTVQGFNDSGLMIFYNTSTAADASITVTNSGTLNFADTSTAGNSSIENDGGSVAFLDYSDAGSAAITNGNIMSFNSNSNANNAVITNNDLMLVYGNSSLADASVTNNHTLYFDSASTAGNSTIVNNDYVSFGGASSAGNATVYLNDGSNLYFGGTSTGSQAEFIFQTTGGSGGRMDITPATGPVTVGSIEGTGVVELGYNTLVTGANNLNTTFSGVVDDEIYSGSLVKIGSGALTLTGVNTYHGSTLIQDGSLVVDSGGTLDFGSYSGGVTNNATLLFIHNAFAGGLNLTNNLGGQLSFLDNATAGNSSISTQGEVDFMGTSTAENAVITVNNGGTVAFDGDSTAADSRIFVNSGGAFDISAHTGGVTADSLNGTGSVHLGSNNLTTGDNDETLSGVIDGTGGSLTKIGTGTLTLAGINTYTGGTNLLGGVLAVDSDSALGDSSGALTIDGATLRNLGTFDSTRSIVLNAGGGAWDSNGYDSTVNGLISGNGKLYKNGSGTLTLTDANSYLGGTVLNGGTLAVADGGALGSGEVDVEGGVLSTSGGPVQITLGHDYKQAAGGTLSLGVGGTGAGQFDSLNLTLGTALLGGNLEIGSYNSFQPQAGDAVTILTAANGVSGQFDQWSNPLGTRWFPIYQTFDVYLLAIQPSFAALGKTENQKAVGTMLDDVYQDPKYEDLILSAGVQSGSALPAIYDQIAPSELTALYQIGFASARDHAAMVEDRLSAIREEGNDPSLRFASWKGESPLLAANLPPGGDQKIAANAPALDRWGVFAEGGHHTGTVAGDGNAPGYQFTADGMTAGTDYRIGKDLEAGLLLGFSQTGVTGGTGTNLQAAGGQAGLYAGWHPSGFYLGALVEGGINSYKTDRQGYGGVAEGDGQGQQFSGWLDAGYDLKMGSVKVSPYASGQATALQLNDFSEQGSLAPLEISGQSESSLSTDLGTKIDWNWKSGAMNFRPRLGVAWEHQFQGSPDSLAAGLLDGGESFTVQGPALGQDAVVGEAELNVQFSHDLSAEFQYRGKFGQTHYDSQSFTGGMTVGF